MNLDDLKRAIPIKWRVQSFSKHKPQATCVAYVDSRQVQDLLDEVVGPENWQDKYEEHKGNLFCSIGIKTESGWVWKTDCGIESNVDKEKGEASDAFKRAAVKWGIGRFLYSIKVVYLPASAKKENNTYPYVVDQNGKQVWNLTEHINRLTPNNNQPKQQPTPKNILSVKNQFIQWRDQKLLIPQEEEAFRKALEAKNWKRCEELQDEVVMRMEKRSA